MSESQAMNEYEQKQEAKRERYEQRAEKLRVESQRKIEQSITMSRAIPFGQPILVGHHSEKSDRSYRNRIGSTMSKGVELESKAEYYEQKAASVGTGGISSDDPEAVAKLKAKLQSLEDNQKLMKEANKLIKKGANAEALAKLGFTLEQAEGLLKGDFMGRIGFASYALTNNNANIRSTKKRIEQLEKRQGAESFTNEYEHFSMAVDTEANRIKFIFNDKPNFNARTIIKKHGFKWSPTATAWIRKITPNAIYCAKELKKVLKDMEIY